MRASVFGSASAIREWIVSQRRDSFHTHGPGRFDRAEEVAPAIKNTAKKTPPVSRRRQSQVPPRRSSISSSRSEPVLQRDGPEGARQVVRARVVSIQRAAVADRRVLAEDVVDVQAELEALQIERLVPADRDVVVDGRVQR